MPELCRLGPRDELRRDEAAVAELSERGGYVCADRSPLRRRKRIDERIDSREPRSGSGLLRLLGVDAITSPVGADGHETHDERPMW